MIKTLRMTSWAPFCNVLQNWSPIVAVVLAVIFFVFPVVFGVRSDKQVEQFLDSSSVIERFNKAEGNKQEAKPTQSSPLVKQSEAFALYLNPRPKPKSDAPVRPQRSISRRPNKVSTKFTLVGTSVYPSHPEQSLAFINEPGKGLHWVRQSSEVGHLIIEQVKDGLVVIRDGQRTFELPVEQRLGQISLLEGSPSPLPEGWDSSSVSTVAGSQTGFESALISPSETGAGVIRRRPESPPIRAGASQTPSIAFGDPEESAAFEELIDKLKDLRGSFESDKTDSGHRSREGAALMEKLISDFRSARVSAEEAKKLDDLGKELKDVQDSPKTGSQQDPNRGKDRMLRRRLRPPSSILPRRK